MSAALPPSTPARDPDQIGFVGRRWLLKRVTGWADGGDGGLLLIAPPGTGKTSIARELTRTWSCVAPLGAVYECDVSRPGSSLDPLTFVERISEQLMHRLPEFATDLKWVLDELTSATRPLVELKGTARADRVEPGGLNIGVYASLSDLSPLEAADRLVRRPLARWADRHPGVRPVVVVDALDNCCAHPSRISITQVITALADAPVRWLLTARPDPRTLAPLAGFQRVDLLADYPSAVNDVIEYASRFLCSRPETQDPSARSGDLARVIADRAAGNFLYAHYVLRDLVDRAGALRSALADPAGLSMPAGLGEVYRDLLSCELRREDTPGQAERWRRLYRPMLTALAVAAEPGLMDRQLILLMPDGVAPADVREALRACRQLLRSDGSSVTGPWAPYHQSFREHLLGGPEPIAEPWEAHRLVADGLWEEWEGNWARADAYTLENLATHYVSAMADTAAPRRQRRAMADRLVRLVVDPKYLGAKVSRLGLAETLRELQHIAAAHVEPHFGPAIDLGRTVRHLLMLLRRGAHVIGFIDVDSPPGMLAQQLHQGAVVLGLKDLAKEFSAHLDHFALPSARLRWHTGDESALYTVLSCNAADFPEALAGWPDGRVAAAMTDRSSGTLEGQVLVWDLDRPNHPLVLRGHRGRVWHLWALQGDRIAAQTPFGTWLWELSSPDQPIALTWCDGCLVELPDGRIACVTTGGVRVWDPGAPDRSLILGGERVRELLALADGQLCALTSAGLLLWDLTCPQRPVTLTPVDDFKALVAVPGGGLAAVRSTGSVHCDDEAGHARRWLRSIDEVWLWNPERADPVVLQDRWDEIKSLVALGDGRLAVARWCGVIHVIDPVRPDQRVDLIGLDSTAKKLLALDDGRLAAVADGGLQICVWNLDRPESPQILTGHSSWISAAARLPGGRLASGSHPSDVMVWDLRQPTRRGVLPGHNGRVQALLALREGGFASASGRMLRVWDTSAPEDSVELAPAPSEISCLTQLPGRLIATTVADGVWEWTLRGSSRPRRLPGDASWSRTLVPLPAGGLAAGAGYEVHAWDTNRRLTVLTGHNADVWQLVALPDGRFASTAVDTTGRSPRSQRACDLHVWDTRQSTTPLILRGHTEFAWGLTVLPDGRLASAGDTEVLIWDLDRPEDPLVLNGHIGHVCNVTALPGMLVVATTHGLWLWQLHDPLLPTQLFSNEADALAVLPGGVIAAATRQDVRLWDPSQIKRPAVVIPERAHVLLGIDNGLILGGDNGRVSFYRLRDLI